MDLKCESCKTEFNLETYKPMLLPCGHSLCNKCLCSSNKRFAYVKCSIDSEKHFNDINSYKTNWEILPIIETEGETYKKRSKYLFVYSVN